MPIAEMAKQTAGTDKAKNTSCSACSPAGSASARDALARRHPQEIREEGRRGRRGQRARLRRRASQYARGAPAARARGPSTPPDAMAGAQAAHRRQRHVRGRRDLRRLQFFGGYPITPSTEIMQFLGREIWKYGGTVLQAEDEIAGIGAVVGASFAGKKAMTATSGPGMSLKTEMLGLASIAELPLVCVNVQRGGPSTGMPTKSEQSDLFQAVFSAHGDVRAAGAGADQRRATRSASRSRRSTSPSSTRRRSSCSPTRRSRSARRPSTRSTRRASRSSSGARPTERRARGLRALPAHRVGHQPDQPSGHAGRQLPRRRASSTTSSGAPTASGEMHARMNEKRFRKLAPLKQRRDLFVIEGDADAPLGAGQLGQRRRRRAARRCELARAARACRSKLLVPQLLYPVAEEVYQRLLRVGAARAGRRAVAPGAALSHHPDVRGRAAPACSRWRAAARTRSSRDEVVERAARDGAGAAAAARARAEPRRLASEASHEHDHAPGRAVPGQGLQERPEADLVPRLRRLRRGAGASTARSRRSAGRRTRSPSSRASAARAASPATRPPTASTPCTAARCPSRRASSWPTRNCWCWSPAATATASRSAAATCRTPSAATSTSPTS